MWCSYCRKADHNDAQCWSTRPAAQEVFPQFKFSVSPCYCVGPQRGEPLCPCAMRGIVIKNGRYVRPEQDLGPANVDPPLGR